MMEARCNEEFALAEEPQFEPMSTWSIYKGVDRVRRMTQAELNRLEYEISRKRRHWLFSPCTDSVEYEKEHTPTNPSFGGFWHHANRAYDDKNHLKPIVDDWDSLKEAAKRFVRNVRVPNDGYHFRTKQEIIDGWDSYQLKSFGMYAEARIKEEEERQKRLKKKTK